MMAKRNQQRDSRDINRRQLRGGRTRKAICFAAVPLFGSLTAQAALARSNPRPPAMPCPADVRGSNSQTPAAAGRRRAVRSV